MATILPRPNVDYTDRDFDALKQRLQTLVRSVYTDWTDFSVANFGNILTEMMCWVGDELAYYQDAQAEEAFWPSVTQRISAIRLGRLINFRLTGAVAATGTERFSLISGVAANNIPIPAGTQLRSKDPTRPLRFRTVAAGTLLAGNSSVDLGIEQAVAVSGETFTSSGAPDQEYVTEQSPYLDDTAEVVAQDGTYEEVESFLSDDPAAPGTPIGASSRVFMIVVDQFDRAHIRFGDGTLGKVPVGLVTVGYKIGGGIAGNVEKDLITVLEDQLYDVIGNPVQIVVTNPTGLSGGWDRMSVLEARYRAPASLRALTRSVTADDFETNALKVSSVSRAAMVTRNEDGTVAENAGKLLIVARGVKLASGRAAPAAPSSTLLTSIKSYIDTNYPPTLTFDYDVEAAAFKTVDVSTRIYLEPGATKATVAAAVRESVKDFFASELADGTPNPEIDFGAHILAADGTVIAEIAWSKVFNAINDTPGVRKVDEGALGLLLNDQRLSVSLAPRQFPVVGEINIEDADTGEDL